MPRVQGFVIRGTDREGSHLLGEKAKGFGRVEELGLYKWEVVLVEHESSKARDKSDSEN